MNITPFVQQCIREGISTDANQLRHIIFNDYSYKPSLFRVGNYLSYAQPGNWTERAVIELSFNPAFIQFQVKSASGIRGDRTELYTFAWDEINSINHGFNQWMTGGWIETDQFKLGGMGSRLVDVVAAVIIFNTSFGHLFSYGRLPYIQKGISISLVNQYQLGNIVDGNGFLTSEFINAAAETMNKDFSGFTNTMYELIIRMATW